MKVLPEKVIQICVSSPEDGIDTLYALCADGSVWRLDDAHLSSSLEEDMWTMLPPIPVVDRTNA